MSLESASITQEELARAIREGYMTVMYQPIVEAETARLVCLEALVRMKRPNGEPVMPDEFIPLAESSDLILELGEWVLRRACTEGLRWPGLRIAVNMSPKQLQHNGFVMTVQRVLHETGFPPGRLELELTERSALDDVAKAEAGMNALRNFGVRIALDDFGTGYSGLIYLRRLPLDKIKIDRAFMDSLGKSPEADILMRSMVKLGRDLGMTVTAEGVEEPAHQEMLAQVGCHELQGYLFSRPLTASDIDTLYRLRAPTEPQPSIAGAA
jgi:EAL domain-containing protein (putative c-di-GMP-specific phosphodiesterase class I)